MIRWHLDHAYLGPSSVSLCHIPRPPGTGTTHEPARPCPLCALRLTVLARPADRSAA
jgi:hypothetical protein